MAIGIKYGRGSATRPPIFFSAPDDITGTPFDAGGETAVMLVAHVNVVANVDHAAVMILQGVAIRPPDLFSVDTRTAFTQLQQGRSGAIAAGTEDIVVDYDRGGDIRGAICDTIVPPEEAAVARAHANDATTGKAYVLPDTPRI